MNCQMPGAIIRDVPGDPSTAHPHEGTCSCNCAAINATAEMEVKGKTHTVFAGCPLILSGRMEKQPDSWGYVDWPEIPLWKDDAAIDPTCKVKADKLKPQKDKVIEITDAGIKHKAPKEKAGK